MNYPLHCTVTYNNLLGRLYRGMRAVAEDASNIYTWISSATYSIGGKYFAGDVMEML